MNLYLIPAYGILGASLSTLLSFLTGLIIIIIYTRQYLAVTFKKNWLIKIILASIVMGGIIYLTPINSLWQLITVTVCAGLLYLNSLFILKFYEQSEIKLAKAICIKIFRK